MTEQIEIVVSWDGNPLESTLLNPTEPLLIGPSASCWFSLPEQVLGFDHELVTASNGGWLVSLPEGAGVRVAKDGAVVDAVGDVFTLGAGMSAEVTVGDFAFYLRPTAAVVDHTPKTGRRYGWLRWMAVAAVIHGIMLALFAMSPPNVSALNGADRADMTRYVSVSVEAMAQPEPEPVAPAPASQQTGDSGGDIGGGESNSVSESSSAGPVREHGRRQPRATATFVPSANNLNNLGVLAVLTPDTMSFGDGSSPFTAGSAHVGDGGLANVGTLLLPRGPSWGQMDMNSTGVSTCDPSVRDCTSGMIDTGDLDTHGDDGPGPVLRRRTGRVPGGVRPGPARTMGALSREQVRRTVRRHINEVRFCYQQSLQSHPELEGRVAVSFIVNSDGAVQSSTVASDSTGSNQVSSCVQNAVRRWTFPAAPGVTGITYPFVMQSH